MSDVDVAAIRARHHPVRIGNYVTGGSPQTVVAGLCSCGQMRCDVPALLDALAEGRPGE